jgi:hypothetical protein
VLLPAGAGEGATVKFIEVGKPPRRLNGSRPGPAESGRWVHSPEGPGPCRVEVYRGERLWIVSAPIYIVEK